MTTQEAYGPSYWNALDSGRGYTDSVMWQDISHIVHELFAMDRDTGQDRCQEFPHVDVGCAKGYMVLNMRKRGFPSFGLDFSHYALSQAPPELVAHLRRFDLTKPEDSDFGQGQFRLLTCFETLEHLPEEHAMQALEHLWRLLSPQGAAVLTICVIGQPDCYKDPTHVNVQERSWWEERLTTMGFLRDTERELELSWFHLFGFHKGVFVVQKP